MGSSISAARDAVDKADKDRQVTMENNLTMLEDLAETKLAVMKNDVILNQSPLEKRVLIDQLIRTKSGYAVDIVEKSKLAEGIGGVVDEFFNGNILSGFKKLIVTGVDGFLGSAEAGSKSTTEYFVVLYNDAICRVDIALYTYSARTDGLASIGKSMVVYHSSISIVNPKDVRPGTLIFVVTEQLSSIFSGVTREERLKILKEKEEIIASIKGLYKDGEGILQ